MHSEESAGSLSYKQQAGRFGPVFPLLEAAVAEGVFPGCAFGVLDMDGLVFTAAVGRQTYAADAPSILPGTLYDLASVTKVAATTAMAMLLWQRKQFQLDQPMADWLPEFLQGERLGQRASVTIRHLLSHSSGLAGYARLFEYNRTAEELWSACLAMPLEVQPGTRVDYSDLGFILLGRVLERIAGGPLDVFCRREIFLPLEMQNTFFQPPGNLRSSIPPTEDDRVFRHRVIQGEVQDENCFVLGGVSGHAGLFGSSGDLLQFARAILYPGDFCITGPGLFTAETVGTFSQRANLPPGSSRALGWDTPSDPSSSGRMFNVQSIGHLGYAGTSIWIDLEKRCAVVLLANRTWPSRENQKMKQLRPIFHDVVRRCL